MKRNLKISVIGAGTWGTTVANLLSEKGEDVVIWAREDDVCKSINTKHINEIFLKNIKLHKKLKATNSIEEALNHADILINAVPVQFMRNVYKSTKTKEKKIIINLSKGIEIKTLSLPSQILKEIFKHDVYTISGPNFAIEIANKKPSATTVSGADEKIRKKIQKLFYTQYLRVYENDDIIGCEVSGAVKNVIAIAGGMCDALNLGYNAKAALITRGLNEIRKLGKKLGAKDITFLGLSGIGDLVLSCNSKMSRNYTAGYEIAKTGKYHQNLHIAEGIFTAKAVYLLSKRLKVEMPISKEVYRVIYEGKKTLDALGSLMSRKIKPEF
ncbi:MAG: NAD(P)H-dependent glycerol-3-phosphate dehydrogenase [Elusimicrobiales bacterium]